MRRQGGGCGGSHFVFLSSSFLSPPPAGVSKDSKPIFSATSKFLIWDLFLFSEWCLENKNLIHAEFPVSETFPRVSKSFQNLWDEGTSRRKREICLLTSNLEKRQDQRYCKVASISRQDGQNRH